MWLISIAQKAIPVLSIIVCILLIGMLQMGFVFLMIALLPAMAAYYVDTTRGRIMFRTVFACNLAAAIPTIKPVFVSGLKFKNFDITATMADPKVWLFIYTGAAAGWAMVYTFRFVAKLALEIQYEFRADSLERMQKRLVEEWGPDVRQGVMHRSDTDDNEE
jgi:hypothetical protein